MTFIYWIKAARLRTLPLALSCVLMGSALASLNNYPINPFVLSLTLLTTILLQVLSNYANDYGDGVKGTDSKRKNSDRMVQSGNISSKQMLTAIIIVSIGTLFSGICLLINVFRNDQIIFFLFFLILGLLSIVAAIKYTVGKTAYGYRGFGDIFVFIFFGIVGVFGTYYLLTQSFHWITIPGALFTGLMSCSVLNMNNMRDYENDKQFKKNTLVVILGLQAARIYQFILLICSAIAFVIIILSYQNTLLPIACLPFMLLIKHLVFICKNENLKNLDSQLKLIALSCFFSCILSLLASFI